MTPTDSLTEEIVAEYRRTRSPFKVARRLGVDVKVVWDVIEREEVSLDGGAARYDGWGPPELQSYLIARKLVRESWDNSDPKIAKARADYEEGVVEMTTGRDGGYSLLYAIPRRHKQPRPNYFTLGVYP